MKRLFPELSFNYDLVTNPKILDSLLYILYGAEEGRILGGNNFYLGSNSNNALNGGGSDDVIVGKEGDDVINGQGGNDLLQGGPGSDAVFGQGGDDIFIYRLSENLNAERDYYDGGGNTQKLKDSIVFVLAYGEYNQYAQEILQYQSALEASSDKGWGKAHGFSYTFNGFGLTVNDIENAEIVLTNRAPTAVADTFITDEDTAFATVDVRSNDIDPDNLDVLTVVNLDSSSTRGTVTANFSDGTFYYDPNNQFEYLAVGESATDTFSYTIRDLAGETSSAVVTINIGGVNDQPVAEDIHLGNVSEDSVIGITGNFLVTDADATDTHTFEIVSEFAGGSVVNHGDGTFTYTPDDDYQFLLEGQDRDVTFTYRAIDDSGTSTDTSEEKTITVTINGAYDAPILLTDDLLFATENQSMWASGPAFVLEPDLPFVGLEWTRVQTETNKTIVESQTFSGGALDAVAEAAGWVANAAQNVWDWITGNDSEPIQIPSSITTPEVSINGWTAGKVGLQPYFSMTSGDVDSNLPIEVAFLVPKQVEQGQTITIATGYSLDGGATFNTASPDVSMGLDLIFQFDAGATASIGNDNYTIFSMGAVDETFNLFDFSAEDIELSHEVEGELSGANLGNYSIGVPVINTQGTPDPIGSDTTLTSSDEDNIMSLTLDVDGFVSEAIAYATEGGVVIPLEKTFSESVEAFGIELIGIEANFNIFDIELTAALKAVQNFSLNIDELPLLIELEDGTQLTGYSIGEDITLDIPHFNVDTQGDADGWLDFNVMVNMKAIFDNLTTLGFDFTLAMEALSASIGITSDLFSLPSVDFGPVWEKSFELYSTDNFATLFDDNFDLLGFNMETTSQQLDVSIL